VTSLSAPDASAAVGEVQVADAPRSRRTLLAGILGGMAATVAGAVGRASPVSAASGDPVRMGRTNKAGGTSTTLQTGTSGPALKISQSGGGFALNALSVGGTGVLAVTKGAGDYGLIARTTANSGGGAALKAEGGTRTGIVASSTASSSITALGNILWGRTLEAYTPHPDGIAILGRATAGTGAAVGAYGQSDTPTGVGVRGLAQGSGACRGVWGSSLSDTGTAGWFDNTNDGVALRAQGNGATRTRATLQVHNTRVGDGAMCAYMTVDSNFATAHLRNNGTGEVLYLHNGGTDAAGAGGGDFITAVNQDESDAQFRVLTSGEVRSDVGFNTPAADFAEMLDAEPGLEPGDVLAIGSDGRLARSAHALQENVAGVYSTAPGFVGGKPVDGARNGHVPLAVVGIVPVKASAENGPIAPGDLLASAATPGHAMRANGEARVGCVIGKALEAMTAGTGRIRMLVVLQ
jgi:hypothetical protein